MVRHYLKKRLNFLTIKLGPLPDRAHTASGDKYAFFTQFITGRVLPMCRELNGIFNNRTFCGLVSPVLQVWSPTTLINQGVNATFFSHFLIAIKRIA
jgi:hypothetical protein